MKQDRVFSPTELQYLSLLARQYPTIQTASREIIHLQAILNLPKDCEHFISDVHGEYEAFLHVFNSCSGVVREKLDSLFETTMTKAERETLAALIYYPEEKLEDMKNHVADMDKWYAITLRRLVELCRLVAARYTRSKVYRALPEDYAYTIEELLHTRPDDTEKKAYFEAIISNVISTGEAPAFIAAICGAIKRLAVDRLHLVGDRFDRGPRADIIMDSRLHITA